MAYIVLGTNGFEHPYWYVQSIYDFSNLPEIFGIGIYKRVRKELAMDVIKVGFNRKRDLGKLERVVLSFKRDFLMTYGVGYEEVLKKVELEDGWFQGVKDPKLGYDELSEPWVKRENENTNYEWLAKLRLVGRIYLYEHIAKELSKVNTLTIDFGPR